MPDKEKVIKGLKCHYEALESSCDICPYKDEWTCQLSLCKDALTLLKEQEAEIKQQKRPDCEHANHDGAGCIGYCGCEQDDEPIDACKQCEKYTGNICVEY